MMANRKKQSKEELDREIKYMAQKWAEQEITFHPAGESPKTESAPKRQTPWESDLSDQLGRPQ